LLAILLYVRTGKGTVSHARQHRESPREAPDAR
jgi:hypothetical protein